MTLKDHLNKFGGFAIPIRGASSRGITESQERQPPQGFEPT